MAFFCFAPSVPRALRVAAFFAAFSTCFWAVSGAGTFSGSMPKSASAALCGPIMPLMASTTARMRGSALGSSLSRSCSAAVAAASASFAFW